MTTSLLYYEAHVTIDPVPEDQRETLQKMVTPDKFKLAKLLMDKGVPSQLDTFMTGHGKDLEDITSRVKNVCETLIKSGYKVRRYKIEDTILDSRFKDVLQVL